MDDSARLEAKREAARERTRRWREANHERALEGQRRWYQANREAEIEKRRRYYQENREILNEASRRRRDANREVYRQQQKQHRKIIRETVLAHYSPYSPPHCACCGTTENLTIDHVNGGGTAHLMELFGSVIRTGSRMARTGGWRFYEWLIREDFPPGYQVLCKSCNTSKGAGEYCQLHDRRGWRYAIHGACTR